MFNDKIERLVMFLMKITLPIIYLFMVYAVYSKLPYIPMSIACAIAVWFVATSVIVLLGLIIYLFCTME